LEVGGADGKTRSLRRACDVDGLERGCLSRGVQGQNLDCSGVGGHDEHEVILPNGGDIVVNGGSSIALGVLGDDAGLKVVIDVDLGDLRRLDIGDVEVTGLGAEAGPARRALAGNREAGRRARGDTSGHAAGEVDNVNAEPGVGRKDGVLALDHGHAERQEAALGGRDGREVLGKGAVGRDVPDGEDARGGWDTLHRRDELRVVFIENNVANGTGGAGGGGGLVEVEAANGVCDRDKTFGLVNREASDTVDSTAVDRTDGVTGTVDSEGDWELSAATDRLPNHLQIRGVSAVDVEDRQGVGTTVDSRDNVSGSGGLDRTLTEHGVGTVTWLAVAAQAL